jgi:hypothetical protein
MYFAGPGSKRAMNCGRQQVKKKQNIVDEIFEGVGEGGH